jgi:hypothetical protein
MAFYKGGAMTTLNPVVLYVHRAQPNAAAFAMLETEASNRCLLFVKVCNGPLCCLPQHSTWHRMTFQLSCSSSRSNLANRLFVVWAGLWYCSLCFGAAACLS